MHKLARGIEHIKVVSYMEYVKEKVKRFKACFISDVEVHEKHIVISDCHHNEFVIDCADKDAFMSFAEWFKNVYMKGIPQTLSIIDYDIVPKNDNESYCKANKIAANIHAATYNEA